MSILVPLALFGWIPIVLLLFVFLPPRRANIAAFVIGWLFLPMMTATWTPGLPEYNKVMATSAGALLGTAIFDFRRLASFQPRWLDVPMMVWCLCPLASSISNGLGAYDGLSEGLSHVVGWGVPYLIGRLYFNNLEAIRELAIGIVLGGLLYVPLCLYEIRMSPQISNIVYGFSTGRWEGFRLGGWRPRVFLEHGLALGIWMTSASLVAVWLWSSRAVKRIGSISALWLAPPLVITTLLCRSTAALGLLLAALTALFATRWPRTTILVGCLIAFPPTYVWLRATGLWDGSEAVSLAQTVVNEYRGQSLAWRFRNENILVKKAFERPLLGWGAWSRSRVFDEQGKDITQTDGLWIIALGQNGLAGLVSLGALFLAAPSILWWRTRATDWSRPEFAPVASLTVMVLVVTNDFLLNGMLNPVFTLAVGAITSICMEPIARSNKEIIRPIRKARPATRRLWPPPDEVDKHDSSPTGS